MPSGLLACGLDAVNSGKTRTRHRVRSTTGKIGPRSSIMVEIGPVGPERENRLQYNRVPPRNAVRDLFCGDHDGEVAMPGQLVLASASVRRKELLEMVGFSVKPMPSQIDETPLPDEPAETFVKRMARGKVLTVVDRIQQTLYPDPEAARFDLGGRMSRESPLRWVLGADTVVTLDGRILGKPSDHDEAVEMLLALQGREHVVTTGFCLYDMRKSKEGIQAVHTAVRFKRMNRHEIEKYLSVGESMDKAGAYAIQGVGAYMVESIQGSYTNVVGLPLCQVVEMMEEMNARDIMPFG